MRTGLVYRGAAAVLRPLVGAMTRPVRLGRQHLPAAGGVVVATNHISYADPLVVAHALDALGRPPRFLAKAELFAVPGVGALLRRAGQIPVHRGTARASRALDEALAALRRGECVVLFPEGTLTRDPDLWPVDARTGAARLALTTRCPLVPAAQWGAHEVLDPRTKRLRVRPPRTVTLSFAPPVDLDDLYDRELDAEVLREATRRLMVALRDELAVVRGEPVPSRLADPTQ